MPDQVYRLGEGAVALHAGEPVKITGASLQHFWDDLQYSNGPSLEVVLNRDFDYPALRWKHKGGYWWAEHEGFITFHFHTRSPDVQDGYGGRSFPITMEDGRVEVLKGPWSGNSTSFWKETGIECDEVIVRTPTGGGFGWCATIPRIMEALALVKVENPLFNVHLVRDKHGNMNYALMKEMNKKSLILQADWLYYDHMRPKDA